MADTPKVIKLSQNQETIVDSSDYEILVKHTWFYDSCGYAARNVKHPITGNRSVIRMHRFITGSPTNMDVDHINSNKLDNRRSNLRICTHAENCRNHQRHKNTTNKYKGISQVGSKWRAQIMVDRKNIIVGVFPTQEDAARAYDTAAIELHGQFAKTNFNKEAA